MSDLFHDQIPDEYIADIYDVIGATPRHTYQILTKRPARMRHLLKQWTTLPNAWWGVSAEPSTSS